jgi:hypothetical protein
MMGFKGGGWSPAVNCRSPGYAAQIASILQFMGNGGNQRIQKQGFKLFAATLNLHPFLFFLTPSALIRTLYTHNLLLFKINITTNNNITSSNTAKWDYAISFFMTHKQGEQFLTWVMGKETNGKL